MKPHQRAVLQALGAPPASPSSLETPPAASPEAPGQLVSAEPPAPRLTLNGGYSPAPPIPRDPVGDHNRLLAAMAQAPRLLPPLERD